MAGKSFKMALNPSFKSTVEIPMVGGNPLRVGFTFKAMGRRDLARLFDKWKEQNLALAKEAQERMAEGNPMSLEEWTEKELVLQVTQIKDIVLGWGFAEEFNDENIEALAETSVSVTDAIVDQYNEGYRRAREGN
jgi:hypothetical protein